MGPAHDEPPRLDPVSLGLAEPMASIMNSVQHVSQLILTHYSYPSAETSGVILTRMCTLLLHLLSLPPICASSAQDRFSALITETARFAILIQVFTPWRGLPPDRIIAINSILHQLMASLRTVTSTCGNTSNALVLWMFGVGGVSVLGMPERIWFINHLAEMTKNMGILTWKEFKAAVSRCIWHEKLYVRAYEKLWDEVVEKRHEIGGKDK